MKGNVMSDVIKIYEHPSNKIMRRKIVQKCKNQTSDHAFSYNSNAERRRINLLLKIYGINKPSVKKIRRMEKRLGKKVIFVYDE